MKTAPTKIAITSLKPHAGRTTTVLALAWWFGQQGRKVLILDLNQYRDLLPGKSETGSSKLWPNVHIGAREDGLGDADVVLIDAPPLSAKGSDRILRSVDGVVLSVFPIAQNRRFLGTSKSVLSGLDPKTVFGWFMARINEENSFHRELVEGLRKELKGFDQHNWIPEDNTIGLWNPLAGDDVPEGALRKAYASLGKELSDWIETLTESPQEAEKAHDAPEPAEPKAEPKAKTKRAATQHVSKQAEDDVQAEPQTPKQSGIPRERRVASSDRRAGRTGTGRRKLDSIPQPFPSTAKASAPAQTMARPEAPRPQGSWSLARAEDLQISVRLVRAEARVELPDGMQTLPDALPASALRALLRFGMVHSRGSDGTSHELTAKLPKDIEANETGGLQEACKALLQDDRNAALETLREANAGPDAALLHGLCALAEGHAQEAIGALEEAVASNAQLGAELASMGLGLLVDVRMSHGLSTHFGPNQRGAHFAKAWAHLAAGSLPAALAELDLLLELEPDDTFVRALRAGHILELGSFDELEALHRTLLEPAFDSILDVVLSFYRAQALYRLGLPDTASLALREAHGNVPDGWPSLAAAMERECQAAVETLARIQRVRNDLASLETT